MMGSPHGGRLACMESRLPILILKNNANIPRNEWGEGGIFSYIRTVETLGCANRDPWVHGKNGPHEGVKDHHGGRKRILMGRFP